MDGIMSLELSIKETVVQQYSLKTQIEIEAMNQINKIHADKNLALRVPDRLLREIQDKYAPIAYKMAIADGQVPYSRRGELLEHDSASINSHGLTLFWEDWNDNSDSYFASWELIEQWEKQNAVGE